MDGRFTRPKMEQVLRRTCATLGLDARGARMLRFTNNAVYALAGQPIVVRILASQALRHRVPKMVTVAAHFQRWNVPAIRLLGGLAQPLELDDYLVTVWEKVPDSGSAASASQLGRLLSEVHAIPVPAGLERWDPLADVRARVSDAEELDEDARRFLLRRCAEVEAAINKLEFVLPRGLVHGDAHPGNVIVGTDGPLLCDFDSSCIGPPEWDLIPLAVGRQRFGDAAGRYRALAETYGFDVTAWEGYPVLRTARELKLTTSVLPILRSRPEVRGELSRRLRDLRSGRQSSHWSRFS